MITKKITCIVCPKGCEITAEYDDKNKEIFSLTGHECKRGIEYATAECIAPTRTLTTTVRVAGGAVLPVRTNKPVPRELLFECMKVIARTEAPKDTKIGDVIVPNILDTGSDIIASTNA